MAVYADGKTIAYNALPAGGIEQVAVLPTVGATDRLYYLTVPDGVHEEGLYYYTGTIWKSCASGGEGGTNDYNDLVNKPRLNGIELAGNKSYSMMDIAQLSNTYTKVQVDTLIASAQKVYLTDSIPTPVNNVGLYYVDTTGTGDSYEIYLVDTARNVAHLGSAGISLAGYQKELDNGLETLNKTVVGGINELKYRIDNLPSGGTITMNGFVNPSPTFYAPTTSGTYNQVLVSRGANAAPEWVSGADSGTKVKLNGSDTVATNAAFYAPPSGGIAGYILKSQGEGLPPTWEEPGAADGATMQLNGALTEVTGEKVKVYAPDDAGTTGQILTSTGAKPEWKNASFIPAGMIMPFAGIVSPDGWLMCDGRAVSRTEYATLFSVIGTLYGEGDKVTTFNLPNLVGKFLEGATPTDTGHTVGTYVDAGLPQPAATIAKDGGHTHEFTGSEVTTNTTGNHYHTTGLYRTHKSGSDTRTCLSYSENPYGTQNWNSSTTGNHSHTVTAKGTNSVALDHTHGIVFNTTPIYGNSTTVQPNSLCVSYMIKY